MDYNTWQRKKINDRFEFPLELDLQNYVDKSQAIQSEDCLYELKAVVIHSGGPYGGHYYAYIKDDLDQGVWDRQIPPSFHQQPTQKVSPPEQTEKNTNKDKGKQKKQKNKAKDAKPAEPKVELDFDQCDFPVSYSKASLATNWFEFNDGTVTAIMPGRLQSTFGGQSGSAYMLVYRQSKLQSGQMCIPKYWEPEV